MVDYRQFRGREEIIRLLLEITVYLDKPSGNHFGSDRNQKVSQIPFYLGVLETNVELLGVSEETQQAMHEAAEGYVAGAERTLINQLLKRVLADVLKLS